MSDAANTLVDVAGLTKHFRSAGSILSRVLGGRSPVVRAVDGVSFTIARGETLALVGESGCGKSTIARLVAGLQEPTAGEIRLDDRPVSAGLLARDRAIRRRIQMIFQDPYASLNPRWRVGDIIAEPLSEHAITRGADTQKRVAELLVQVGLAPADAEKYPHQFSGGQRQRISVARALATGPEFLICDEPTSALDVSVQAQVLNLMKRLQRQHGLTYLFISHNLAVVNHMADRIAVMYLGRIVELAPKARFFAAPRHPYARMLLDAVPRTNAKTRKRRAISGEVPSPIDPPSGCTFHPRCPLADARCRREVPLLRTVGDGDVACHAVEEGRDQVLRAPH
jgi:peptide/nickel transport system ATP-binding protein